MIKGRARIGEDPPLTPGTLPMGNAKMNGTDPYLMENPQETIRLEVKTDPETLRKQALLCGVRPGLIYGATPTPSKDA